MIPTPDYTQLRSTMAEFLQMEEILAGAAWTSMTHESSDHMTGVFRVSTDDEEEIPELNIKQELCFSIDRKRKKFLLLDAELSLSLVEARRFTEHIYHLVDDDGEVRRICLVAHKYFGYCHLMSNSFARIS